MKKLLVVLNLVLLAITIALAAKLSSNAGDVAQAPTINELPTPESATQPRITPYTPLRPNLTTSHEKMILDQNLFDSERIYQLPPPEVTEDAPEDGAEEEEVQDNLQFELMGLVMVGSRASATLTMKEGAAPDTTDPRLKRPPRGPKPPPASGLKRGVVQLGKEVFESGWFFTEAHPDAVVLSNPEHPTWEPRLIELNMKDEGSKARLSSARDEEHRKLEKLRAEQPPPVEISPPDKGDEPAKAPDEAKGTTSDDDKTPIEKLRERVKNRRIGFGRTGRSSSSTQSSEATRSTSDDTNNQTGSEPVTPGTNRTPVPGPRPPGLP